jgi:hypothetical protein
MSDYFFCELFAEFVADGLLVESSARFWLLSAVVLAARVRLGVSALITFFKCFVDVYRDSP